MGKKKYICTYFDYNYLPRGLALYRSLEKNNSDFVFFILTFDEKTYDYLKALNEEKIKLISLQEYDSYFNTSVSKFADKKQYFFSATPNICLYLIETHPEIDILLYLDADVYLFNSLEPIYEEFGNASIGFTPHRVHPLLKLAVKNYGHYNVGVNLFRNSDEGLYCLRDWKNECDSWYPDKPGYPLKFFSDQIFLDTWVSRFSGLKVIENIGVNVCYWNAVNYRFSKRNEVYFVNDNPLIIYHFSSLRKESEKRWNAFSIYGFVSVKKVLLDIYIDYIGHIESFGIGNKNWVKMKHKESVHKRFFHFIMKFFINEIIIMK